MVGGRENLYAKYGHYTAENAVLFPYLPYFM
jgi:hypothetical protein